MKRAEVGIFCLDHWFKNVWVPHGLGSKKGIVLLKEIWDEQKGRCAVTGEVLIPGSTASLDHIIPKSRGGSSSKENLRWVLLRINQIKWDMTHDEFVATCRMVVREQDRREAVKPVVNDVHTRSN
jgi:5-methylcytosine-specific restriction endonuclease McrA